MPNWVYNTVEISGNPEEVAKVKAQLNKPITKNFPDKKFNQETQLWEDTAQVQHYSNPVFSFWNIIAPTNLDAYYGEQTEKIDLENFGETFNNAVANDQSWYYWNVRNWGSKWDVAVYDNDKYSDTYLENESETYLLYKFNTAWSPVYEVFDELAKQHPTITISYDYEEETGWGGEAMWEDGKLTYKEEYDIPNAHADFDKIGRQCFCETLEEPSWWFADCPIDKDQYEMVNGEWTEKANA